jgi:hypothetical protein
MLDHPGDRKGPPAKIIDVGATSRLPDEIRLLGVREAADVPGGRIEPVVVT